MLHAKKYGKRALAMILTVVMLMSQIPAQAVAAAVDDLFGPPAPYDSTNDVYEFGGNAYKVLSNGYIACYASMADGSFTVLPAAVEFDPGKSMSHASFRIDGTDYRYGVHDTNAGTVLISPNVENGVMETQWKVGDYVISQVHAIRQEASRQNAWAVSVGYIAEYFGEGESDISARLLLDTLLGENDDLPFITGNADEPQLYETLIAPVPESLYVGSGENEKAFLVNYEFNDGIASATSPSAIVLADFVTMAASVYDVEADTERAMADNDSGAAVYFERRTLTKPAADAETVEAATAAFKLSYGFTDLEFSGAGATSASIMPMAAGDAVEIGWEIDGEYFTSAALPKEGIVGGTASFRLDLKYPDMMEIGAVKLEYEGHYNDDRVPVIPEDGLYSFVIPDTNFVFVNVELTLKNCAIADVTDPLDNGFGLSLVAARPLTATTAVVAYGETVKVQVDGVGAGDKPGVSASVDWSYPPDSLNGVKAGTGTFGDLWEFAYTIPTDSKRIDFTAGQGYDHAITTRVLPSGKNIYLSLDAPYANGQHRANKGDTVEIFISDPDIILPDYQNAKITVNEINGSSNPIVPIFTDFSGQMTFEMPDGDVEVLLELTQIYPVTLKMPVNGDAGRNAISEGCGRITLIPAAPEPGEEVLVYINLFEGASLDEKPAITDGVALNDENPEHFIYKFTMPDSAVTITAKVTVPDEADRPKMYSVYTKPLVRGNKIIADFDITATVKIDGGGFQNIPLEYTGQAPAGATVNFVATWPGYEASTKEYYTLDGKLKYRVVMGNGDIIAKGNFAIDEANDHVNFEMPGEPVTLILDVDGTEEDNNTGIGVRYLSSDEIRYISIQAKDDYTNADVPNISTEFYSDGYMHSTIRDPVYWEAPWQNSIKTYTGRGVREPHALVGDLVFIGLKHNRGSFSAYQFVEGLTITNEKGEDITSLVAPEYLGFTTAANAAKLNKYKDYVSDRSDLGFDKSPLGKEYYDIYAFSMPNANITVTQKYKQVDASVRFQAVAPGGYSYSENQKWPANLSIKNDSASDSTRTDVWDVQAQMTEQLGVAEPGSYPTVSTEFLLSFEGSEYIYEVDRISYTYPDSAQSYNTGIGLEVVWRTANSILYRFSQNVSMGGMYQGKMPTYSIHLKQGPRLQSMRVYTNSYIPLASEFKEITLSGINMAAFDVSDLTILKYDGNVIDKSRLTVKSESEMTLDMQGVADANVVGAHYLQMRWNYNEPYAQGSVDYNAQIVLEGPKPPTPPGTAKYIGIVQNSAGQYELLEGTSRALMMAKVAGKKLILDMGCDAGFTSQVIGGETRWEANGGGVIFGNGLSARPSSGLLTPSFRVSTFFQAADNSVGVRLEATSYSMYAQYLPVYIPNPLVTQIFKMELLNGVTYSTAMPEYLTIDTDSAPVFDFVPISALLGPNMELDVMGFGGFKADYSKIKYLSSGIDLSGELSVQLPEVITDGAMAGIKINNLILNFNNGNLGFDGVNASGGFVMPSFMMLGAVDGSQGFEATINTFEHIYEFDVELDAKIIKIKGTLNFGVSERLTALNGGGAIVVPDEFYFDLTSDYGIPIIPGMEVANINGVKGGFSGLIKTIDYSLDKGIPAINVTAGGTFKLLSLIEFDAKFTVGVMSIRTELGLTIADIEIFKKYVFGVGMRNGKTPGRLEIFYAAEIALVLIPGLELIEASGSFEVVLGMNAPTDWAKRLASGRFDSIPKFLNATNLALEVFGSVSGSLSTPGDWRVIGGKTIMNGTAEIYGKASIADNGINLDALRAYAYGEFIRIGFYFIYDFKNQSFNYGEGAGPGSARSFAVGLNEDALLSERLDNGHGKMVFGEGMVKVAASDAGDRMNTGQILFGAMGITASALFPTIAVSDDGRLHTVSIPDSTGMYYVLIDAPKETLNIYGPGGTPYAISMMPEEATAEQAAVAYNTLETPEGSLLIALTGAAGDWTIVAGDPFKATLYKYTKPPVRMEDVGFTGPADTFTGVGFKATGLAPGAEYLYDIVLQKKPSADAQAEATHVLAEKQPFTATSDSYSKTFDYALAELASTIDTGDYYPKVMLYKKMDSSDPMGYVMAAVGFGNSPYKNKNLTYDTDELGLLTNLNAVPGGNATLYVTFSHPELTNFKDVVNYRAAVYEYEYDADTVTEIKRPFIKQNGEVYALDVPSYCLKDGKYAFYINGLEPGMSYTVEVTPVFVAASGEPKETRAVLVPVPNEPVISLDMTKGKIEQGTVYAMPGAELTVTTDQDCDIVVKKYVGSKVVAPAANGRTLTLPSVDNLSGSLLSITATNADGDTTTEYVTVLVIDAPPPLVIDLPENGVVTSLANGSFAINGTTHPNTPVASTLGFSAESGGDGRFAMNGTITGDSQTLYLIVTDKAGNSGTAAVTVVRGTGGGSSGGGTSPATGAHGYTVTTPDEKPAVTDVNGTITLPGGGTIKTPEGLTVTAPEGTTIDKTGLISIPNGKEAGIGLPNNDAQISVSGGTTVNRAGLTSVPASGSAKIITADGALITVPGGATIALSGAVTPPQTAGMSVMLSSGLTLNIREGTIIILDEDVPLGYYAILENPFADVKADDWFFEDVGFAYSHGLFAGTGAAAFSPRAPMTRGMLVTVLGRLHGIDTSGFAGGTFSDVDAATYYAAYVEWARAAGVVSGVGDNKFAPDTPISRQDLAVILYNYIQFAEKDLPKKREYEEFLDDADIASYASDAVNALYMADVIRGKPGNLFDPKGEATRAEVAAMLHRFIITVSD